MRGVGFSLWRLHLKFNWARTGTWAHDAHGQRRTELVALCIVQRGTIKVLSFVIGPVKVMAAMV